MFYRNTPKLTKKLKYTRLKLNFTNNFDCDKDYLNVDFPKYCINFNNENNELINSYGDNDFCCSVSQNGDGLLYPELGSIGMLKHLKYFLKTDGETGVSRRQMIVEDYNSNVYFSNLDDGTTNKYDLVKLDDNCDSRYFTYYHKLNNYLIISTLTGEISKLYVYDGDIVRTFEDVDFIYSICTLNDYVFIVKADAVRNKVYFYNDSNPYNLPFNISKMQSIGVPVEVGQIEKVLNYNDCLYVVCEYGIVRIQCYKNQDEFDIEEVCYGLSKVVCGSIVKGDDSIFFATDDFVYQLKGNSIEKIDLKSYSFFDSIYKYFGSACFESGKYYLALRLGGYKDGIAETYDNQKNNSLIVYDTTTKKVSVCFDISIKEMEVYYDKSQSRVAILSGANRNYYIRTLSQSGKYNKRYVAKKFYKTHIFDLKNDGKKIVREISFFTREDIILTFHYDNGECVYNISGSDKIQKIIINKRTKQFSISFISETENPLIKHVEILVGEYV